MPIYPECKFGIDDSINSIVEVILERLKIIKWTTSRFGMDGVEYLSRFFISMILMLELELLSDWVYSGFAFNRKMLQIENKDGIQSNRWVK